MKIKSTLIVALLVMLGYTATAQQAKLQVSNLAPRVGDEITVSLAYFSPDQPKEKRDPYFDSEAKGELKINKLIKKEGSLWIGPFTYRVGDELLTTDSVELQVLAPLPSKDTIVLRQVKVGEKEFLIVEQVIENTKDKKFIALENSKIQYGIVSKEKMSFSASGIQGKHTHSKKIMMYSLQKENYTGGVLITSEHFKHLPANISLNNYEIL